MPRPEACGNGRAATVAATTGVPAFGDGRVADRDVVRRISESVDAAVRRLRPRIEETEKTDVVTQDLFIEITAALEEARRMWQAQNAGYESDTPAG